MKRRTIDICAGAPLFLALTALIVSCARHVARPPSILPVAIAERTFFLEVAADPQARQRGLSGRSHIDENGGMLFVFPETEWQAFVMRDCPIPIDLLYLDRSGRVINVHSMTPEPARSAQERAKHEAGDAATRVSGRTPAGFRARSPWKSAAG